MAINEQLANRVRESLTTVKKLQETKMFGGLCLDFNKKAKSSKK